MNHESRIGALLPASRRFLQKSRITNHESQIVGRNQGLWSESPSRATCNVRRSVTPTGHYANPTVCAAITNGHTGKWGRRVTREIANPEWLTSDDCESPEASGDCVSWTKRKGLRTCKTLLAELHANTADLLLKWTLSVVLNAQTTGKINSQTRFVGRGFTISRIS